MTKNILNYWKFADAVMVTIAIIVGIVFNPTGWVLFLAALIPMLLNQAVFYFRLNSYVQKRESVLFGITKSRILSGVLSTILLGGATIFAFYYFDLLNSAQENITNWVWMAIIISRMVESMIPFSYWTVIEVNNTLFVKKTFGIKEISLHPEMTIRKITNEKVELNSENLSWELPLRSEEIEKLTTILQMEGNSIST